MAGAPSREPLLRDEEKANYQAIPTSPVVLAGLPSSLKARTAAFNRLFCKNSVAAHRIFEFLGIRRFKGQFYMLSGVHEGDLDVYKRYLDILAITSVNKAVRARFRKHPARGVIGYPQAPKPDCFVDGLPNEFRKCVPVLLCGFLTAMLSMTFVFALQAAGEYPGQYTALDRFIESLSSTDDDACRDIFPAIPKGVSRVDFACSSFRHFVESQVKGDAQGFCEKGPLEKCAAYCIDALRQYSRIHCTNIDISAKEVITPAILFVVGVSVCLGVYMRARCQYICSRDSYQRRYSAMQVKNEPNARRREFGLEINFPKRDDRGRVVSVFKQRTYIDYEHEFNSRFRSQGTLLGCKYSYLCNNASKAGKCSPVFT